MIAMICNSAPGKVVIDFERASPTQLEWWGASMSTAGVLLGLAIIYWSVCRWRRVLVTAVLLVLSFSAFVAGVSIASHEYNGYIEKLQEKAKRKTQTVAEFERSNGSKNQTRPVGNRPE